MRLVIITIVDVLTGSFKTTDVGAGCRASKIADKLGQAVQLIAKVFLFIKRGIELFDLQLLVLFLTLSLGFLLFLGLKLVHMFVPLIANLAFSLFFLKN